MSPQFKGGKLLKQHFRKPIAAPSSATLCVSAQMKETTHRRESITIDTTTAD